MSDEEPTRSSTVTVFARANLSMQGQTIAVYDTTVLERTAEVQACIDQQLLVEADGDGNFPDLGPLWPPITPPGQRCCGK